jgi:hypothetical protein
VLVRRLLWRLGLTRFADLHAAVEAADSPWDVLWRLEQMMKRDHA